MRSLGIGLIVGLFSSLWLALLSFIFAPIQLHVLGIEGYSLLGIYTSLLAVLGIIDVILSTALTREIACIQQQPHAYHRLPTLLRTFEILYMLTLGLCLLVSLPLIYFSDLRLHLISSLPYQHLRIALILMILSLAVHLPSGLYIASLIGLQKQALSAGLTAVFGTLRGGIALLVTWFFAKDINLFFLCFILVGLLQTLSFRHLTWFFIPKYSRPYFSLSALRTLRNAAGAILFITIMGMILSQLDKIALPFILTLESVGHYLLAWALASSSTIIATPIVQGYAARFSSLASARNFHELRQQIKYASQLTFALVIPSGLTIAFFGGEFMRAWVHNPHIASSASIPLPMLAIGTALIASAYPLLFALYANQNFKPVLIVQFVCVIIFLPLLLFLSRSFGISGAALSWLIYSVFLFFTYLILVSSIYGVCLFFALLGHFISTTLLSILVLRLLQIILGLFSFSILHFLLIGAGLLTLWFLSFLASGNLRRVLYRSLLSVSLSTRS